VVPFEDAVVGCICAEHFADVAVRPAGLTRGTPNTLSNGLGKRSPFWIGMGPAQT